VKAFFVSDLHLDSFTSTQNQAFFNTWPEADLLLLLGDYHNRAVTRDNIAPSVEDLITPIADKYNKVLYIAGNHDSWGRTIRKTKGFLKPKSDKFVFLNNDSVVIDGVTFFGGTLWYKNLSFSQSWCDEVRIFDGVAKIPVENQRFKNKLSKLKTDNLVVMSHHLPSFSCVHEDYADNVTNQFFVDADCEAIISELKPKLWLHGHTHKRINFMDNKTRIMANPRGYYGENTSEFYQEMPKFGLIDI
jgi:predicted MPP superfamily phosphohydrolase